MHCPEPRIQEAELLPRGEGGGGGGTNFNGSLFSNYGINFHHFFSDRKTIKQPVRLSFDELKVQNDAS